MLPTPKGGFLGSFQPYLGRPTASPRNPPEEQPTSFLDQYASPPEGKPTSFLDQFASAQGVQMSPPLDAEGRPILEDDKGEEGHHGFISDALGDVEDANPQSSVEDALFADKSGSAASSGQVARLLGNAFFAILLLI